VKLGFGDYASYRNAMLEALLSGELSPSEFRLLSVLVDKAEQNGTDTVEIDDLSELAKEADNYGKG
jgi:hypothetical protein